MKRLPPLNALRVFEAAARHLSFTKAADELHVTPGAVSQQIKALEEFIGAPVFKRHKRTLLLTDEAQAALPVLRDGFERLADAGRLLSSRAQSGKLAVSVAPSFAAKWLVPRLHRFHERHAEVDVWISADMEIVDFSAADIDVAIRYGAGRYEGVVVEHLMSETIVPVCSPRLLSVRALNSPADLVHHVLLHDGGPDKSDSSPTWPMWLKAAGVSGCDGMRGPKFNQSILVLEAAVAGKGVALAKHHLARADLDAGRLVIPFDRPTPSSFGYYVVHPHSRAHSKTVKAFKAWLHEEAARAEDAALARAAE